VDNTRPQSTVDRPWTAASGSPELRPPAAPVSTGADQGAGEESGMRGVLWVSHRGASGSVAAGHHGGAVVVGGARWGGVPARERRREELGEGRDAPGVLRGFYRGRGAPETGGRSNGGVNGFNTIEDGGEVKRGIKGVMVGR
jgi:hypothetical protein